MESAPASLTAVALFSLLAAGGLLAGSAALRRLARGQPLVPYEPRRPAPWTALDVGLVLGMYLAAALASGILLAHGRSGAISPALAPGEYGQLLLLDAAVKLGVVTFALTMMRVRAGADGRDMGFVPGKLAADLRLGAVAFLTVAPPIYLLQMAMQALLPQEKHHPIVELLMNHPQPWLLAACGLAAVIVAPVTEELLFRLLLQGCLEGIEDRLRRGSGVFSGPPAALDPSETAIGRPARDSRSLSSDNPYASPHAEEPLVQADQPSTKAEVTTAAPARSRGLVPIVATSLVFAALHQWPDQVPLFFLSLALGYVYRQTHRILPSIVMHLCLNLTSLTMLWLAISSGAVPTR